MNPTNDSFTEAFVGRERELATMTALLTRTGAGSALIEGEAGIGKTRLLAEFLRRASHGGVRILRGHCYQQEPSAYFPFLQVLRQLRAGDSAKFLQSLSSATSDGWTTERPSDESSRRRADFLNRLSEAILGEIGSTETILSIEDIQWADVASLLALNNLLDMQHPRLLIVCTMRPDEQAGDLDRRQLVARIEQKSRRIRLRGLSRSDAHEFLAGLDEAQSLAEEESRYLTSFTKGNPMLLRELFLHLTETGLLDRHTLPEAIKRSRTPDRLDYVIDARLQSLPGQTHSVLSACAVAGAEFSVELITEALCESEAAVRTQIEAAVAMRILEPLDGVSGSHFRFAHALFVMRFYEILPTSRRRSLHEAIARVVAAGRAPLSHGELARHYALGLGTASGRRAIDCCRVAAEGAERLLAFETAASFWELALKCTRPRSRRTRAQLHRRLGLALKAAGKWTLALGALKAALELFDSLDDTIQVGQLALSLGEMHRWRQEYADSEGWLERALPALREPRERARALALLAGIRCLGDQPELGRRLAEEAYEVACGGPFVSYWVSPRYLAVGYASKAYAAARKGFEEARQSDTREAVVPLAASLVHHELGRLSVKSAQSYERILRNSVDPTDTTALTYSLVCEAVIGSYAGRWKNVLRSSRRWLSLVRLAGRFHLATARMYWGEAKLALGDPAGAEAAMLLALPELEQARPTASLHLARVQLALGKKEAAASITQEFSELVLNRPRHAPGRLLLGEVVSCLSMPELWQRCYDQLGDEDRPIIIGYSCFSVQRVLGRLATTLKQWPAAIQHFDTAINDLTRGGARWELAQTYFDYSGMRLARGRRGDTNKAAAAQLQGDSILEKLGIAASPSRLVQEPSANDNRFSLTGREMEVLALVAEGRRNNEIAAILVLSRGTVNRHLENILGKMGATNRTEAVVLGVQEGLVGPFAAGRRPQPDMAKGQARSIDYGLPTSL